MCRSCLSSQRWGLGRGINHYNLGVTKAGAHTGIEAGICPDPRTSVHSSGRETDVPIRDPVSTADSTHRSHANRRKSCSCCSNTQRMGGPRGGAEDPARSGGSHELGRYDHRRECALAKRCIPHTKGYICPNKRKREVIAVTSSSQVGRRDAANGATTTDITSSHHPCRVVSATSCTRIQKPPFPTSSPPWRCLTEPLSAFAGPILCKLENHD